MSGYRLNISNYIYIYHKLEGRGFEQRKDFCKSWLTRFQYNVTVGWCHFTAIWQYDVTTPWKYLESAHKQAYTTRTHYNSDRTLPSEKDVQQNIRRTCCFYSWVYSHTLITFCWINQNSINLFQTRIIKLQQQGSQTFHMAYKSLFELIKYTQGNATKIIHFISNLKQF